jgi:purine-binding chemotaxis protein CheW
MTQPVQFVTLGIDRDVFAVPVENVQEILDLAPVARLPQAPACVVGIIDVRGKAYPVVDLRIKLGLPQAEPTPATRILVLRPSDTASIPALGVIADRVFEVTALDSAPEPAPSTGGRWRGEAIAGIGRRNGNFVVVLDIAALLAAEGPLLEHDDPRVEAA